MEDNLPKPVSTNDAPEPAGHYSQATVCGNLIFVSGQLPIVAKTGEKCTASIDDQTAQVLKNVNAILISAGSSKDRVVKATVYIADISLWDRVDSVYADFFGSHRPARAVVPTRELHYGFQIEIEVIASLH